MGFQNGGHVVVLWNLVCHVRRVFNMLGDALRRVLGSWLSRVGCSVADDVCDIYLDNP
jgi:hypothetical protein